MGMSKSFLLIPLIQTAASARRIAQEDEYYYKFPPPPPSPVLPTAPELFKPGTTVIVASISAVFTITFVLLLYVQRCKTASVSQAAIPLARVDSGVNRKVIQQLPLFRFASLRGQKDGLECAVCLTRFEAEEVLRLLPKCKHAFHVECVDTWLDQHSTCPLCRYRVRPEDVLLVDCYGSRHKALHNYRLPTVRHSSASGSELRRRSSFDGWSSRRRRSGNLSRNMSRRSEPLGAQGDRDRHRLEHKILVSDGGEEGRSEVPVEEELYLRTEMLMADGEADDNQDDEEETGGMRKSRSDLGERKGKEREEEGIVKRLKDWIPQFQQKQKAPAKSADASSSGTV
ncbi:RING-type E3 ubiquitin transferase [Salvia divinorum]|uniref:RING-type E3 ubiquitin transferase n=1 Tax=Salvia divinorum TaxID=28513 RepID=A0ABD1HBR6_SALDI